MKNRLNKIFKNDGKTFILAMDHGSGLNVLPELAEPEKIIDIAIHNGVDAIICTYGIYKRFSKIFLRLSEQMVVLQLLVRGILKL